MNRNAHVPICRYASKHSKYKPEGDNEKPKDDKRIHEDHDASFSFACPKLSLIGLPRAAGLRYFKIPSVCAHVIV